MTRYLLAAFLILSACDSPPCLDKGETARVEQIGVPISIGDINPLNDQDNVVKLRLKDNTKRVCVVPRWVANQLTPNDVIRGPISQGHDWKYQ